MYDATSEPHEFFGTDREEARAKAATFFGRSENELEIRELDAPEISGLGARAVVVAWPQGERPSGNRGRSEARSDSGGRPSGRGEGRREGRGEGRGGRRGEGRDRDRDRDRDRERGDRRGGRGRGESAYREPADLDEDLGPSKGTVRGSVGEVGQFILGVVERMDIGPFEISETQEENFVIYQVSGGAAHRLTSGEGKGQDALQLLANQAAARLEEEPKRIVVDAEGDPDRRDDFLTRIASRAARRASDTGRSVALDPMNGRDRRAIHIALREQDGIATMSIGEGRYRQVVVVPEGAPEYEEALDSVRRASSNEE